MGDVGAESVDYSRNSLPSLDNADAPLMRRRDKVCAGAKYPHSAAVIEDEEGRGVDLKWDLLHPAFIAPFRRGPDKLLWLGTAA